MIAVFLAMTAHAVAAEPPRFPAAVARVYVDAFVNRGGAAVTGLRAADFELRDNGVPQQVEVVEQGAASLAAVLVLDTSESVRGETLQALREAARAFAASLGAKDEVALLTFSHAVRLTTRASDPAAFARALDRVAARSSTSLYDAIYAAARLPVRARRRLIMVFTDGADNTSWLGAADLDRALRTAGVLLYAVNAAPEEPPATAVSFGDASTRQVLERLAASTGGRVLEARTPEALGPAFAAVIADLRSGYVLGYSPTGVALDGDHRLEVRVRRPGVSVRARTGYRASGVRRPGP